MHYFYFKALHIISVVSWFSGLFYLVRLFIYDIEAEERPKKERDTLQSQLRVMQRRLWFGITLPAAISTAVFGGALMYSTDAWKSPWFATKAVFLVGLYAYHDRCGAIRKQLLKGDIERFSSRKLRLFNEVATVFLFAIVMVAVTKTPIAALWGVAGFFGLGVVIMGILRVRRKK